MNQSGSWIMSKLTRLLGLGCVAFSAMASPLSAQENAATLITKSTLKDVEVLTVPPTGAAPTVANTITQHPPIVSTTELLSADPAVCCDPPRKRFEFLPNSLLWEPKLADKAEARLSIVKNDVDSVFSRDTLDPSIGLTTGVLRFRPEQYPWIEWQVDLFAVSHLRFSRGDESIAQNYRAGIPVTFRTGNWQGKIGYEHTSTQLGDELMAKTGKQRFTFERDEAVIGLAYLWGNQLRTYGEVAYAVWQSIPNVDDRWRYNLGVEWFKREATTLRGQPFAAIHAAFNPEVDYNVNMNYQVGWMWRKPDQRLGQVRVYAEFYDGRSMFGQLFQNREQYAGFGLSLDY
jgi:Protein of unknown function (DUF1207)